MRKLFIIISLLIVTAGASISVMQMMGIGPFAPKEGDVAEESLAEKMIPQRPPSFLEVNPLMIPIFQEDRVVTTVQIQLKLEVKSENEEEVRKVMPRISDAYLRDLYSYVPRMLEKHENLDLKALKQRLMWLSEKIAGPGMVDDVLIQSVMDNQRG
ncbi:MAG: hypothetical protein OQJ99_03000 [Rhodospirillales bacterium]|nr:hypothetical protein [Rhodospirillales bacterium]MCW8862914.1 hypothetical protein [Rhodospirillales bacterium]MCW8951125.1 hypothetical protein [Rhodospirillales bacterium]MCW8969681.1 hypothetical protein [Rhodospirillales bacterium]MCW9003466.1 hypothetical protein [Rhodospirillales bacterium]